MTTMPLMSVEQAVVFWTVAYYVILLSALSIIVGCAFALLLVFVQGGQDDVDLLVPPPPPDPLLAERTQLDADVRSEPFASYVRELRGRHDGVGPAGPPPPARSPLKGVWKN